MSPMYLALWIQVANGIYLYMELKSSLCDHGIECLLVFLIS